MDFPSDISSFLLSKRQPQIMEDFSHDRSRYLSDFAERARKICRAENSDFVILQHSAMQAFAAQGPTNFVAMYAGMFWMLSRLAASVAASAAFPELEGALSEPHTPDPERSLRAPRELLNEATPFDWNLESVGWGTEPERVILFYFTLDILFKFVVFHELGHLHNDHGRRRGAVCNPAEVGEIVAVDELGPLLLDDNQGVQSHAREIIADCTGLEMTIRTFSGEWELNKDDELNEVFRKVIYDEISLIIFILTIINLYFRLSDRRSWNDKPLTSLSHPPAPMRMNILYAYIVENWPLGIDATAAKSANQGAHEQADHIMSLALNVFRAPDWAQRAQTPEWSAHYRLIHEESKNWTGPLELK